jgi:hypothetical protein
VKFYCLSIFLIFTLGFADEQIPSHVTLAFKALETIKTNNNLYVHRPLVFDVAGYKGASETTNFTDCSGLMIDLFRDSYGVSDDYFIKIFGKARPLATDFYSAFKKAEFFEIVSSVKSLRSGDIIAVKYVEKKEGQVDTGHVMLVVSNFQPSWLLSMNDKKVSGSRSYQVPIIDSSKSAHSMDTRAKDQTGLGMGWIRLFQASESGPILGYTWGLSSVSVFQSEEVHPLVIARLKELPKQ